MGLPLRAESEKQRIGGKNGGGYCRNTGTAHNRVPSLALCWRRYANAGYSRWSGGREWRPVGFVGGICGEQFCTDSKKSSGRKMRADSPEAPCPTWLGNQVNFPWIGISPGLYISISAKGLGLIWSPVWRVWVFSLLLILCVTRKLAFALGRHHQEYSPSGL